MAKKDFPSKELIAATVDRFAEMDPFYRLSRCRPPEYIYNTADEAAYDVLVEHGEAVQIDNFEFMNKIQKLGSLAARRIKHYDSIVSMRIERTRELRL